ncbi:MAG: NUDIX domain-containing protein [Candidatus Microsaccharimonas sp.]
MYDPQYVSVKIALYSQDNGSVLVMCYPKRDPGQLSYGLPGGHIDGYEKPDDALRRELQEELSLIVEEPERRDFFRKYNNGDLVLAYTAKATDQMVITPTNPHKEYAIWVSRLEVETLPGLGKVYKEFILRKWPT